MKRGYINAVWLTCPSCQHSWHQKIIETKKVETDCRCDIVLDMEIVNLTWGGTWCNIIMTLADNVELGKFSRDDSAISNDDRLLA